MAQGWRVVAWVLAPVLVSCTTADRQQATWERSTRLGELWAVGDWVVTQRTDGELVALNALDGVEGWRYRRPERPQPRGILLPRPRLACVSELTPSGTFYLTYSDLLVALEATTGRARWTRPLGGTTLRTQCPAPAPDSGLVLVARGGRSVVKLDAGGEVAWSFGIPDRAVVRGNLVVVPRSGDVIFRTTGHLMGLDPRGRLNWAQALP